MHLRGREKASFQPERLYQLCGSGVGSRMAVSTTNLLEGWHLNTDRKNIASALHQGKRSKQVEAALTERGYNALPSEHETETETDTCFNYEPSPQN